MDALPNGLRVPGTDARTREPLRALTRSRQTDQALSHVVTWDLVESLRAAARLADRHEEREMQECLMRWAQNLAQALGRQSESALGKADCTEPENWFG